MGQCCCYDKFMENLGLARGAVKLVPHNEAWRELFLAESKLLQEKLGVKSENIQHVGSTSIPGILAKPIIDIAIVVDSLDIAEQWVPALAEIGYWYKGLQPDMPDRRFFAKGPEEKRTIYLHIVNKKEFTKLIKFRDILRSDQKLAQEYSDLKENLAAAHSDNRANYSNLKNNFIQNVLSR